VYAYDRVARQFFIVAFLLLYAGNVCAAVVFVDHEAGGDGLGGDWENACTTIASGLSAASATDEVWVADGTYPESVTLVSDVKLYGGFDATEASLEDRSDSAAASIIDANGSGSAVTLDTISDALIDGFTITGGNASVGGGIYASNADDTNTISNCIITWNTATSGGGIDLAFGSSPYITDCIISNNTAENGGGIYFSTSSSVITNCTIIANTAEDGDGNSGGGAAFVCIFADPCGLYYRGELC
jgi:predicted outer membrane repeat protein